MPAPGDQHVYVASPFEGPVLPHYEYSAEELATIKSRLEKQLGPEFLASRNQGKGKVHYLSGDKSITLANEVFGFNGWSSSIIRIETDFCEVDRGSGRTNMGVSVIVRVTLRDGTYHEDIGYGLVQNGTTKGQAWQKAKKEGTTDALKRALRQFGNILGNCVYDKAYLEKVLKVKTVTPKFDESRLHRHPDYVVKKEATAVEEPTERKPAAPARPPLPQLATEESFEDFLEELDEADFNITDDSNPDEFILPNSSETKPNQSNGTNTSHNEPKNGGNNPMQPPARQLARTGSTGNNPPRKAPQTPVQQPAKPNPNNFPGAGARGPPGPARPPQQFNQARPAPQPQPQPQPNNANQNQNQNRDQNPQIHMTPPPPGHANVNTEPPGGEGGFLSARAMKSVPEKAIKTGEFDRKPLQVFNPRLESPSIPRTPGVDHSASKPLTRHGQHVPGRKTDAAADDCSANAIATANGGGGGGGGAGNGQGFGAAAAAGAAAPAAAAGPRTGNMVNPQLDHARRIGAPPSSSPLGNRGQFRPLTVKRPAGGDGPGHGLGGGDGVNGGPGRVPLGDVSNAAVGAGAGGIGGGGGVKGPDSKRQRTS